MIESPIDKDPEREFRLERREVYDCVQEILQEKHGGIFNTDDESKQAMDIITLLRGAVDNNEIIREAIKSVNLDTLQQKILERNEAYLKELSEGLNFYGDVQAIITEEPERNRVIDLKGIVVTNRETYEIGLIDERGDIHEYSKYKGLLAPTQENETDE